MNNNLVIKKEQLNQLMTIEYLPVESDYKLDKYEQFSLDKLKTMGLNLASIAPVLNDIKVAKQSMGTSGTLFRMVPPKGVVNGVLQTKNGMTLGHFVNPSSGKIAGRASFEAVSKGVSTVNPYALLITAAVSIVTKKLDTISDNQMKILEFLELQEDSKIKGNVKTLQEISEQYKYNIDNEKYKNNKCILIQDIKKESEQSIILAKQLISSKASKTSFIHTSKSINNKTQKLEDSFNNYQLALYQFSYASFLEVMLLENFDQGYLNCVYAKIIEYIEDFRKLHNDCYDRLLSDSKSSVESIAIRGFAGMTKGIGKAIQKITASTSGEEDTELLEFSDKVKDYNNQRIESKLNSFLQNQEECSLVFAENIKTVNSLFNNELDVLFNEDSLYIAIN